jgi:acetoin utilization protein AcuC
LDENICNEWNGNRSDLANLANLFAGGTILALEYLLRDETQIAIHFPGAKHHAQYDRSSGFCVFADFALAAQIASKRHGKRVAILDIDAHHGDGTENLTQDSDSILTYSIHEYGIFPGTGLESIPEQLVFNYPLGSSDDSGEPFSDDAALLRGIEKFILIASEFQPDLIFVACGADGHKEDPLSSLKFSVDGYRQVANKLKSAFPNTPLLVGGAGGYLPDTRTPEVWSAFATTISQR